MSGDLHQAAFEQLMNDQMRWASQSVTLDEVSQDCPELVRDLQKFDFLSAAPLLASLLTVPAYQANCIRLELLTGLATLHCRGRKKAHIADALRWFTSIGASRCVSGEDPSEDVFVTLVHDVEGNFRLLEGIWENAGFYTQRVLDVVETMPDSGLPALIKSSVHALLRLSDLMCQRADLHRYQIGEEDPQKTLNQAKLGSRTGLVSRVQFTLDDLLSAGVDAGDLEPFIFDRKYCDKLAWEEVGSSSLGRRPLMLTDAGDILVLMPTALSVAVRSYVIETLNGAGLLGAFDAALAEVYSRLLYRTHLLGELHRAPVKWQKLDKFRIAASFMEFDRGHYLSIHYVLPSSEFHFLGGFQAAPKIPAAIEDKIKSSIECTIKETSRCQGFRGGIVLLVICGWGQGHSTSRPEPGDNWMFAHASAADLCRLSNLPDMSPGYFWRLHAAASALQEAGVFLSNINGIVNLIGWVQMNEGHLVPHSQMVEQDVSPKSPLHMMLPTNLTREVRAKADRVSDRHRALDPAGLWRHVHRAFPDALFPSDSQQKLFVSLEHVDANVIACLYEGARNLWIEVPISDELGFETSFSLWEMTVEWLHRAGHWLDENPVWADSELRPLKVRLHFRGHEPDDQHAPNPTRADLEKLWEVQLDGEPYTCVVTFASGYLNGFRLADNVAERVFVVALSAALLGLSGHGPAEARRIAEAIEESVVPNDAARSFHAFTARTFSDFVRHTLPPTSITANEVDSGAVRLSLGQRTLGATGGRVIQGIEPCTGFLGDAVDVLLKDIHQVLQQFDRHLTLQLLISNIEKASTEDDRWRRTSAALLGLHGCTEDTRLAVAEAIGRLSQAIVPSRILTEMAICECPLEGGKAPARVEVQRLLASVELVIHFGGLSDAIYFQALPPNLYISALGDVLVQDNFGQMVVQPILQRLTDEKFQQAAMRRHQWYEPYQIVETAAPAFGTEFPRIWAAETGFSLDEGRVIIDLIENMGIETETHLLEIRQQSLKQYLISGGVDGTAAASFLRYFCLLPRKRWDKVPNGFRLNDIYPWKLGRRLSLSTRPILAIDTSDDPLLLIPPMSLRKSFIHVLGGAFYGRLEQSFFKTPSMRDTWWGKAREGHTFTSEVAASLEEAGWTVRENIKLTEVLNRALDRDYGDVDVLAWNGPTVLVIECKDLAQARNYSEMAALLSDYQGGTDDDGEADKLKKHLDRFHLLQNNIGPVQKFVVASGNLTLVSCLVCSGVVPMQYANSPALATTLVGSVDDVLKLLPIGSAQSTAP